MSSITDVASGETPSNRPMHWMALFGALVFCGFRQILGGYVGRGLICGFTSI